MELSNPLSRPGWVAAEQPDKEQTKQRAAERRQPRVAGMAASACRWMKDVCRRCRELLLARIQFHLACLLACLHACMHRNIGRLELPLSAFVSDDEELTEKEHSKYVSEYVCVGFLDDFFFFSAATSADQRAVRARVCGSATSDQV